MRNGHDKNLSTSSPIECDVGLGLKMSSSTPYYNYQHLLSNANNVNFHGGDGGPMMNSNDIYEAAVADTSSVLPMTFFRPTSREGGLYGKAPFTASQWQELERQKIIHKYMMANITVPPQLLLPISTTFSQSPTPGLELRFPSSGSDLEPWRCKRTDGKKWRCSRDVAPDQKYCERHAHKSKARSRKHVEISPHKFINNAIKMTPQQANIQRPTFFPAMASATTTPYNDHKRSIEWFMKCGANNQQQWQQVYQTSSSTTTTTTLDFSRHNSTDHQQSQYEDKQPDYTGFNNEPYIPDTNFGDAALELNADKTTRHFIDAWEKEGLDQMDGPNQKGKKFLPSSSLSLSMSAGNVFDDEEFNYNGYLGIGTMNNASSDRGIMNMNMNMNMNPMSWMNNNSSPPGGPLGEALCLGNASSALGNSNLPSPYYSNSNTNTNSSSCCSKSSCEDGNHALNFIG